MKGKSPMMKALIGKQNNLPEGLKAKILASPAKKGKLSYKNATMSDVKGDKYDDKQANKQSQMSYTDDFANKSFKDLKSNYTAGKTYKQKDRDSNTKNAKTVRAYRDQQKNVKAGMDSLGNPIKMKKKSPAKMKKASPAKKAPTNLREKLEAQRNKRAKGMKSGKVTKEKLQGALNQVSNVISPKKEDGTPQQKKITTKGGKIKLENTTREKYMSNGKIETISIDDDNSFKAVTFKGKKGDPYSYRTTKGGGYEYSKDGKTFTKASGKGAEAISKIAPTKMKKKSSMKMMKKK
tara:strand:+ start:510 stop:1388 length:879 start_codon:yes stop_codon:yes gene_type:complete